MSFITDLAYKAVKLIRSPKLLLIKKRLGHCGKEVFISMPCRMSMPQNVFLDDFVLIQHNCSFVMNKGKVFMGKWASIAHNTTFITDNHVPTVGINHRMLGMLHINDRVKDIHIGEECWVGAGAILMSGTNMGRGSVAAAGAVVNKSTPPYSVVAGVPAKIIASVFTKEQIIEHEKYLYPEKERLSEKEIDELFDNYFQGKKTIGIEGISKEDRARALKLQYMQEEIPYNKLE